MKKNDLKLREEVLHQTAFAAGRFLKKYFGRIGLAHAKSKIGIPVNLVSKADTGAQRLIVGAIRKRFPRDSFLAEEGDLSRLRPEAKKGPLWVIDPLDGTVNFLHGFPYFAVSIAFCMDGVPLLGAIYDPIREELFRAKKGSGAYLNQRPALSRNFSFPFPLVAASGGGIQRMPWNEGRVRGQRLQVTRTKKVSGALMVTGFGYDRVQNPDFYLSYYRAFLVVAHDVRRTGAACVDLAWVAAGRSDGFWECKLSPWDVAAGKLLVEEAGGQVTHFDGSSYDIFKSQETLATNGRIHQECLKMIRSVQN